MRKIQTALGFLSIFISLIAGAVATDGEIEDSYLRECKAKVEVTQHSHLTVEFVGSGNSDTQARNAMRYNCKILQDKDAFREARLSINCDTLECASIEAIYSNN